MTVEVNCYFLNGPDSRSTCFALFKLARISNIHFQFPVRAARKIFLLNKTGLHSLLNLKYPSYSFFEPTVSTDF